jgi:Fe-S-cluster containining protein
MSVTGTKPELGRRKPASGGGYGVPTHLSFPQDEVLQSWLPMLLDAYLIADQGVAEGVRRQERQGRVLACRRGCAACCRSHKTIPVYPLELVGISWYATEKVQGAVRDKLRARLRQHRDGASCPFLVDEECSIHAMRPMACRHFNVFDRVCAEGEDAYYTRRQDVLTPIRRYLDGALEATLPFYGITRKPDKRQALRSGAVHGLVRVLRDLDWASLADRMDAHDRRRPTADRALGL